MPDPVESQPSTGVERAYDRTQFRAFQHFYIPAIHGWLEPLFEPIIQATPPIFVHLAESFKQNLAGVVSTASMPFRIASANYSRRLFHQILTKERILALKDKKGKKGNDEQQEEEETRKAFEAATKGYQEVMRSEEERYKGGLICIAPL